MAFWLDGSSSLDGQEAKEVTDNETAAGNTQTAKQQPLKQGKVEDEEPSDKQGPCGLPSKCAIL